jgi:two-component system, cell cycle response regulator DivK
LSKRDNSYGLILVVDDNENNREVLNLFLAGRGYKTVEASNGLEAVAIAISSCPDLILMDLSMPVMDGFTAVRLIRAPAETSGIPIVACTAYHLHRDAALGAGFVCTADANEAVDLAKSQRFDLYLIDHWMPGVSGTGLTERLRELRLELRIHLSSSKLFICGLATIVLNQSVDKRILQQVLDTKRWISICCKERLHGTRHHELAGSAFPRRSQ